MIFKAHRQLDERKRNIIGPMRSTSAQPTNPDSIGHTAGVAKILRNEICLAPTDVHWLAPQ